MTNPRCETCHGWGYVPDVVPMQICEAVYPDDNSIPPELRGQPCTPRTKFRLSMAPAGVKMIHRHSNTPVRTASDKRRETREANAAKKGKSSLNAHR